MNETSSFHLTWVAAPRPPVHPNEMIGKQSFLTFDDAVNFMKRQASDARFVSLTEVITRVKDRSDDARDAIGGDHAV